MPKFKECKNSTVNVNSLAFKFDALSLFKVI